MAARTTVSAAILCGGSGRRMGGTDKGQLVVGGQAILQRLLDALRPLTPNLMLIDRDGSAAAPAGVHRIQDAIPGAGALGGLYTALVHAPTDHVLVVACDMPFVTTEFLAWLAARAGDADVVIPRDEHGRHPICGLFHRRVAPALRARIDAGRLRVDDALAGLDVHELDDAVLAPFNHHGRLLLNVNTPADYAQATRGYDTP